MTMTRVEKSGRITIVESVPTPEHERNVRRYCSLLHGFHRMMNGRLPVESGRKCRIGVLTIHQRRIKRRKSTRGTRTIGRSTLASTWTTVPCLISVSFLGKTFATCGPSRLGTIFFIQMMLEILLNSFLEIRTLCLQVTICTECCFTLHFPSRMHYSLPPNRPRSILRNEATIAIHSRHSSTKDDGSVVEREVKCLQKMLLQVRRPCRVFVMSDRPKALEGIYKATTEMGCNVTIANHKKYGRETSFSVEHGPFAGGGFFLDMALASQARNGLVGMRRSSTMFLAELMAFGKLNDTYRTEHHRVDEPYIFCDYEHGCDCSTVVDASF